MSRSRPAGNPLSFHKHTGQYYVTREGKRVYLGIDPQEALEKYHRLALGQPMVTKSEMPCLLTAKELANRFIAAQQANWRNPELTLKNYQIWLGRFLEDHPRLKVQDFTVEMFASWKVSLRNRNYSPESINSFLSAVRAMFLFAEDSELIEKGPKLRRVKNESGLNKLKAEKPIYSASEITQMVNHADAQLQSMILLAINCGFGPKDIQDLTWQDIADNRISLARSKTGVGQTFVLWPETQRAIKQMLQERTQKIARLAKRGRQRSDGGQVFITRFWNKWTKDAIAEQFTRLCEGLGITSRGFYRLRHSASTLISQVALPHVQRKFMRHAQLQQQVTYTHTPDDEVDKAIMNMRHRVLGTGKLIVTVHGGMVKSKGAGCPVK